METFGLSWKTELTFTSMRGIIYVTSALNDVCHGDSW